MKRRDMLISTGAALWSLSAVPFRQNAAAEARGGKTYYIDPLAGDDAADWRSRASAGACAPPAMAGTWRRRPHISSTT